MIFQFWLAAKAGALSAKRIVILRRAICMVVLSKEFTRARDMQRTVDRRSVEEVAPSALSVLAKSFDGKSIVLT